MVGLLARFDLVSQKMLQRFCSKLMVFAALAAFVSVLKTHGLVLAGVFLQSQCAIGAGFSIVLALSLRQRFDAATLTYWDEGNAFSGIGVLSHIAASFLQTSN